MFSWQDRPCIHLSDFFFQGVSEHEAENNEKPENKQQLNSGKSSIKLIRRSTKRRTLGGRVAYTPGYDPTLESIQRGQKMLDARLQDLQVRVYYRDCKRIETSS